MKSYYRVRNFVRYSPEPGLRPTGPGSWNTAGGGPVAAVRPRGIATPVYYRPGTDDLIDMRNTFGRQRPVGPTNRPRLIVDADPGIGFAAIGYASRYPNARVLAIDTRPEHRALLRRNCERHRNITIVETPKGVPPDVLARVLLGRETGLMTDPHRCVDLLKLDLTSAERELLSPAVEEWLSRVRTLVIDLGRDAPLASCDPLRSAFDALPHRRYHLTDRLVIDFA